MGLLKLFASLNGRIKQLLKIFWPLVFLVLYSCTQREMFKGKTESEIVLIKKGKKIYMTSCISCHNPNPKLTGTLGPAVFGTSFEVLKYKMLKGTYPKGYQPKRSSQMMPTFPEQRDNLDALHAFLNF